MVYFRRFDWRHLFITIPTSIFENRIRMRTLMPSAFRHRCRPYNICTLLVDTFPAHVYCTYLRRFGSTSKAAFFTAEEGRMQYCILSPLLLLLLLLHIVSTGHWQWWWCCVVVCGCSQVFCIAMIMFSCRVECECCADRGCEIRLRCWSTFLIIPNLNGNCLFIFSIQPNTWYICMHINECGDWHQMFSPFIVFDYFVTCILAASLPLQSIAAFLRFSLHIYFRVGGIIYFIKSCLYYLLAPRWFLQGWFFHQIFWSTTYALIPLRQCIVCTYVHRKYLLHSGHTDEKLTSVFVQSGKQSKKKTAKLF